MSDRVNIVCMKWGTRYPAYYVNRLLAAVKVHLSRPFRFICLTREPEGLDPEIEVQDFPPMPEGFTGKWPSVFTKLALFKDGACGLEGQTMFLDIDQIILGDLDKFFDYRPGEFCIIHNWVEWRKTLFRKVPDVGNSSCFRFEAGRFGYVYDKFLAELERAVDKNCFRTEQAFMTYAVGIDRVNWWPEEWVVSFKRACTRAFPLNLMLPPVPPKPSASILCFHGHPNPHEAAAGYRRPDEHLNVRTVAAPWVEDLWANPRKGN